MCFSASASFTASAALGIIGVKAVTSVRTKKYVPFAAIPLLFSVQQFLEGLVWLALQNEQLAFAIDPATYGYIFFAFIVWPCWIPYAMLQAADYNKQKKILRVLLAIGAIVATTLAYYVAAFGVTAQIDACHILYVHNIPELLTFWGSVGYLIATIIPFFVLGNKKMYAVGALIALAYAVSYYAYYTHLTSVWCFFAAIISLLVVWANE